MNNNQCNEIRAWFFHYVENISHDSGILKPLIQLKLDHSLHVADDSREIAENLKWPLSEIVIAETLGLLHDVGRFSQIVEFRTFSDPDSINHGERGYHIIRDLDVLSSLPAQEQLIFLDGIHYHNVREIPHHICKESLRYIKLLRDADKLDIFRVINDMLHNGTLEKHPEITLNIDLNGPVSPAALAQILNEQTVSYENIKSLADFGLTQLSWIYDINYYVTFQRIIDRSIIEKIIEFLPENKEIKNVVQKVNTFITKTLTPV